MTSITTTRPARTLPVVGGTEAWSHPAALLGVVTRAVVRLSGRLARIAEESQLGPDAGATASRWSGARV